MRNSPQFLFWWRWLIVVTVGILLFGIGMVLAPAVTRRFFSLLLFSSSESLSAFGAPVVAYITLVHGVLGAVMFGWGVALLLILLGPFRGGAKEGWLILVGSLLAWFVPDTVLSCWLGYWQNAVFNATLAMLFAVPLGATHRAFYEKRT